jgi:hypothetical protein
LIAVRILHPEIGKHVLKVQGTRCGIPHSKDRTEEENYLRKELEALVYKVKKP